MACKEHHRIGRFAGSLEGCWILAGGNTPGHRALMTSRPGGALEKCKLKQGMQSKSRYARKVKQGIIPKFTLNLGCAHNRRLRFRLGQPGPRKHSGLQLLAFGASLELGYWSLEFLLCPLCSFVAQNLRFQAGFKRFQGGGGIPSKIKGYYHSPATQWFEIQ